MRRCTAPRSADTARSSRVRAPRYSLSCDGDRIPRSAGATTWSGARSRWRVRESPIQSSNQTQVSPLISTPQRSATWSTRYRPRPLVWSPPGRARAGEKPGPRSATSTRTEPRSRPIRTRMTSSGPRPAWRRLLPTSSVTSRARSSRAGRERSLRVSTISRAEARASPSAGSSRTNSGGAVRVPRSGMSLLVLPGTAPRHRSAGASWTRERRKPRGTGLPSAGVSAIDALREVNGVSGTVTRPRAGRSRSNVTKSSIATRTAATSTATGPRLRSER